MHVVDECGLCDNLVNFLVDYKWLHMFALNILKQYRVTHKYIKEVSSMLVLSTAYYFPIDTATIIITRHNYT